MNAMPCLHSFIFEIWGILYPYSLSFLSSVRLLGLLISLKMILCSSLALVQPLFSPCCTFLAPRLFFRISADADVDVDFLPFDLALFPLTFRCNRLMLFRRPFAP